MRTSHQGTLRAKVTLLGASAKIEWINHQTQEVVWTETCAPREGMAFVSQIECTGSFRPTGGYFVDASGKRHFVLNAEVGSLGAVMGNA